MTFSSYMLRFDPHRAHGLSVDQHIPDPICGFLHGAGSIMSLPPDYLAAATDLEASTRDCWIVLRLSPDSEVRTSHGHVWASKTTVAGIGDVHSMASLIYSRDPDAKRHHIIGMLLSGLPSEIIQGADLSHVTVGAGGVATTGKFGTATAGAGGVAIAGYHGQALAENGKAIVGREGRASVIGKSFGLAVAEEFGTAIVDAPFGTAISGIGGTSIGPKTATVITGYGGHTYQE